MSGPDTGEWELIWRQFDRLVDRARADQAKLLRHSALPPALQRKVERLLAAHGHDGVLDRPLTADAKAAHAAEPAELTPGATLGHFQVEQLIGRGGAGEVYRAHRVAGGFGQTVALKLMRAEAAPHLAAFEAERALQASFEHPGIARLIDGGAGPHDRPWMALELVEGVPITRWCADHAAPLATRLDLFLQVCDAVAYAHARLVVHCDLKPGNILVTPDARVKLLDFGIAQVISQRERAGDAAPMRLTPDYAAPEQLAAEPLTVATDVWGLGCILAELLTGTPPWQPRPGSLPVVIRRLQGGAPRLPSDLARALANPPIAPARLTGDLDAIVARATQPRAEDRYPGVLALAEDVRRHCDRRPVAARSASLLYRARLFTRRHYMGVTAAALAIVATIGGVIGTVWQAHEATLQRDVARDRVAQLQATNQVLLLMFRDIGDSDQMRGVTVRDMLGSTSARLLRALPPDSPDAAPAVAALADIYLITESNRDARALLTQALARGVGGTDPAARAQLQLKLGTVLTLDGDFAPATRLIAAADAVFAAAPNRYRAERVEATGAHALLLRGQGHADQAIALLQRTMPEAEVAWRDADRDLATRYASLATMLADRGDYRDADRLLDRAAVHLGGGAAPPGNALLNLQRLAGDLAARSGDAARGGDLLSRTVAARRRWYGSSLALSVDLLHRGRLEAQQGRFAAALRDLDEAGPMMADHFGAASAPMTQIKVAQAYALAMSGDAPRAAALLPAANPAPPVDGRPPLPAVRLLYTRAAVALARGRAADARVLFDAAETAAAQIGTAATGVQAEAAVLRARFGRR
ncbi:protein kinase domain-containing protein [Sphingomonas sp.]|uniref:serine/threonine-protein kinase n=1 Tax=Sphingomonas sp. TaxID=28214 RepID=UPI003CC63610